MPKITGFHHTAIRSTGFDASVGFYENVLGLKRRITRGKPGKRAIIERFENAVL
ncbi:MAG: hypothetical protein NTV93_18935 [Verrucomicrobia bacterium]|nr:hypothetical protein [Verrucomicrobiota bacterium]